MAIGSVAINRLLKGQVSARYATPAVLTMGLFVIAFFFVVRGWEGASDGTLYGIWAFLDHDDVVPLLLSLLGIPVAGGMFVVPLYAFLTTTVDKSEAARTVAANNIVNSGLMVAATLILTVAVQMGVTVADSLLIVAVATIVSAWLGWKLHLACD